jgi:hypothetical protein
MRRAPLLVAVLTAASASCQLVYGLGDFHPADAGATTGAGGGTGGGGHGPIGGAAPCGSDPSVVCLAPAPGFNGTFHLVEGPPGVAPDRCASGATPKHFYQDPTAGCVACGCDAPPTPPCSAPEIDLFAMTNCPADGGVQLDKGSGNCLPTFGGSVEAAAAQPLACHSSGGGRSAKNWMTEITLCEVATTTEGCKGGESCVPTGEPICMIQNGAVADCPSGWGSPRVVYGGAMDTLGCAACSCTPNFTCTGRYLAYQGNMNFCLSGSSGVTPDNCTAADFVAYEERPPAGTLSCDVDGGDATGAFTPSSPTTICCLTP